MTFTRRTLGLGAAALALPAILPRGAAAQTVWNMPTPYGDGNYHTQNIRTFVDAVAAATNGGLRITVHSNGSLFPHPQIKRNVRQGLAPIGEVLISLHANEAPIYGIDSVPFLVANFAEARRLYAASKAALEARLAEEEMTLLFSVAWPPQGLFARQLITSVDDLRGNRFRTYNPGTARIAAIAGATPVQVEAADLSTAFATGRVQTTITSAATGVDTRIWEFTTHYHDLQAWIPRNMVIVNRRMFQALPAAQQAALREAADAAETRGWEAAARETGARTQILRDNRMTVVEPAPALRDGLRRIGAQIAQEWEASAGDMGRQVLARFRASA
jgi:TRAP-type C4-dicarboxylate transport system substrate-binding protein